MARRTIEAATGRAFGRYLAAEFATGGTDHAAVARRVRAVRANEAAALETCWHCLAGIDREAELCPACGTEQIPF